MIGVLDSGRKIKKLGNVSLLVNVQQIVSCPRSIFVEMLVTMMMEH